MTTTEASTPLRALGFKDGWAGTDWRTHPLSDKPIAGLVYLHRKVGTQHQYVSLCGAADGTFTEAVVFVYPQPLDPRNRERPLFLGIRRTIEEVAEVVGVTYPALSK